MEDITPDTWAELKDIEILRQFPDFDAARLQQVNAELQKTAKGARLCFLVRYAPGDVIMAKGMFSDFAALHLQGRIRVKRDQVGLGGPATARGKARKGCWATPLGRRLDNWLLTQAKAPDGPPTSFTERLARIGPWFGRRLAYGLHRLLPVTRAERLVSQLQFRPDPSATATLASLPDLKVLTVFQGDGDAGTEKPLDDRLLGVTSTLWNQPRTATLVADNDAEGRPCELLLVKRRLLLELLFKPRSAKRGLPEQAPTKIFQGEPTRVYLEKMKDFAETTLPTILARNRLFHPRLFVEDVADWDKLTAGLKANGALWSLASGKLKDRLGAALDEPAKAQVISELNGWLDKGKVLTAPHGAEGGLTAEGQALLARRDAGLTSAEAFQLNRLLLEAALPGAFTPAPAPWPLSMADFQAFAAALAASHQRLAGGPLLPDRREKNAVVFKEGADADTLYLILNGMARVSRALPGGQAIVNNLSADGYFGEGSAVEPPIKRGSTVETLCRTFLLPIPRPVVRDLVTQFPGFGAKLARERQRNVARDQHLTGGQRRPPAEPPQFIASRLLLTQNLLLIDMERCTRCDQCVRACAETHDLKPRFHRANPDLRFGKWEVAGACLHCMDAPCMEACPVGAITLLANKAVQIHRDRCIGCAYCAKECPFQVIDMYQPVSPEEGRGPTQKQIATKCDLCLTDQNDPPCVVSCPYGATQRVQTHEFFPGIKGWATFSDGKGA